MPTTENYCIREDYIPRASAETYVDNPFDYWTEKRIANSGIHQYYVYARAAAILASSKGRAFLDIGCGYPHKVRELILPATNDVTLIDQPCMNELLVERFPDMKFIPMNLESGDSSLKARFDCVVCSDVIEHLLDPDPLIKFIRSVVDPEGFVILSTPERDIERGINCLSSPKREHVREWNTAEFCAYLDRCNLNVIEHSLLPKSKLRWMEQIALPLTKHLRTKRYSGCQMALCTANPAESSKGGGVRGKADEEQASRKNGSQAKAA